MDGKKYEFPPPPLEPPGLLINSLMAPAESGGRGQTQALGTKPILLAKRVKEGGRKKSQQIHEPHCLVHLLFRSIAAVIGINETEMGAISKEIWSRKVRVISLIKSTGGGGGSWSCCSCLESSLGYIVLFSPSLPGISHFPAVLMKGEMNPEHTGQRSATDRGQAMFYDNHEEGKMGNNWEI